MIIKTGRIYHIKDTYFKQFNDKNLIINHDDIHSSRPMYLALITDNICWFIPLSSKVNKYKKIIEYKKLKYKKCRTIMICKINSKEYALLIQNAIPVKSYYIKSYHFINRKTVDLSVKTQMLVRNNLYYMLSLKKEGLNLFFTDIETILKVMTNDQNKKYKNKC